MDEVKKSFDDLKTQTEKVVSFFQSPDAKLFSPDRLVHQAEEVLDRSELAIELLSRVLDGQPDFKGPCRAALDSAFSRLTEAAISAKDEELKEKWERTFDRFTKTVEEKLSRRSPKECTCGKGILKISEKEYHLVCSVCSKIPVIIREGTTPTEREETGVVYQGIMTNVKLKASRAGDIFNALSNGDLKKTAYRFGEIEITEWRY